MQPTAVNQLVVLGEVWTSEKHQDAHLSMQLTSSDHDELEEDEDGRHDLRVLQASVPVQLLAEQVLEDEQQSQHEQTPEGSDQRRFVRPLKKVEEAVNC